ncbi:MAG: DUF5667 domain-containing protein [Candidatus Peribacteraceae bacterium]|nr:DUF5667 domain-containing protein [Candidatus Peribacteraceae bacterium]
MSLWSPSPDGHERAESLLSEAARAVEDPVDTREAVKRAILKRIRAPEVLRKAVEQTVPVPGKSKVLWKGILSRISSPLETGGFWDRVRASLAPSGEVQAFLRGRILGRLQPVPAVPFHYRMVRWTAVAAVLLLAIRVSPLLFLAPQSRASSPVLLVPAAGEVSVLMGGLWQPVQGEVILQKQAVIRTGAGGAATIIVHDDGVLRLGADTTVDLRDLSDRPSAAEEFPTIELQGGTLWVQSLVPAIAPSWSIDVPGGRLVLHESSVSLAASEGDTEVQVWNRAVFLFQGKTERSLVAGEGMRMMPQGFSAVRSLTAAEEEGEWVSGNLRRDAVHRREIALLQQERRTKNAGILPTSPIYPVKRVAETVDMLFTFGQGARTQKLLQQASTRLNEAAALLATGSGAEAAEKPLEEYKQLLLAMGSGSGQDAVVSNMVQEQVAAEVSDVTAVLPDDDAYAIKKTVLETSAALPQSGVKPEDVEGVLLVDSLNALTRRAQEGDVAGASDAFKELEPSLALTTDRSSPLSQQLRKEARAALTVFAHILDTENREAGTGATVLDPGITQYLPSRPQPVVRSLSDDEINSLVMQMVNRIFLYKQPRSRYNQLLVEFRSVEGNADRGKILRRLYHALPEDGLARYVRTEFQKVREEVEASSSSMHGAATGSGEEL